MESVALTPSAFRDFYGDFYSRGANMKLQAAAIPEQLKEILHYAEFWGITDDSERERLADDAPAHVIENLKRVIDLYHGPMDSWLGGAEANSPAPTREYLAFSAMRMAADYA